MTEGVQIGFHSSEHGKWVWFHSAKLHYSFEGISVVYRTAAKKWQVSSFLPHKWWKRNDIISFHLGQVEVIRSHLRQEHLNRWKTCKGCCQCMTLMSEPLPSRTEELQAVSRQKLRVAVGLLPGHRIPRAHMFKLGLTQWQDCWLCEDKRENSVHWLLLSGTGMQKDRGPWVLCSWSPRI